MLRTTARCERYIASLQRRPHVTDLGLVRQRLEERGLNPPDWLLEFHGRFAGYVEPMILDEAVYGLVHEDSRWLPGGLDVEIEPSDWMVACADAHPSYDFWLGSDGSFAGSGVGGPAESFVHKLEQDALLWTLERDGSWRRVRPAGQAIIAMTAVADNRVAEASDSFTTVYYGPNAVVLQRSCGNTELFVRGAK